MYVSSPLLKKKAGNLRKKGYSYTDIRQKIGVSKSTLSVWLGNIPYTPNALVLKRMEKARRVSVVVKNRQKLESIALAKAVAKKDVKMLSQRDVFMLGLGIYIGEGTKTHGITRVINSNPLIIKFIIKWFKDVCGLGNRNFVIRLYLYPDNNQKKSIKFWSRITGIPVHQFHKVQIDKRTNKKLAKRGKLPYGTAHLGIRSFGEKRFGIFLSRKINAWIDEVLK